MTPTLHPQLLSLLVAAALAACAAAPAPSPAPPRLAVTSANQLPRTSIVLPVLPSELFGLPAARLAPIVDDIERSLDDEQARFHTSDRSTLDGYSAARLNIAMSRGAWAAVPALVQSWRARQDKPAAALTTALLVHTAAAARASSGDLAAQRALFRRALTEQLERMPWDVGRATRCARRRAAWRSATRWSRSRACARGWTRWRATTR
jgi:hypothetical protein